MRRPGRGPSVRKRGAQGVGGGRHRAHHRAVGEPGANHQAGDVERVPEHRPDALRRHAAGFQVGRDLVAAGGEPGVGEGLGCEEEWSEEFLGGGSRRGFDDPCVGGFGKDDGRRRGPGSLAQALEKRGGGRGGAQDRSLRLRRRHLLGELARSPLRLPRSRSPVSTRRR